MNNGDKMSVKMVAVLVLVAVNLTAWFFVSLNAKADTSEVNKLRDNMQRVELKVEQIYTIVKGLK